MSHITTVSTEIKDLDAVKRAVETLGLGFEMGKAKVKYFEGFGPECDAIIYLRKATSKSRYELGLRYDVNTKSYELVADEELIGGRSGTDSYGRNDPLRKILGENCGKFLQEYSFQIITDTYGPMLQENPNLRLERDTLEDGSVKIRIFDASEEVQEQMTSQLQEVWQ